MSTLVDKLNTVIEGLNNRRVHNINAISLVDRNIEYNMEKIRDNKIQIEELHLSNSVLFKGMDAAREAIHTINKEI